MFITYGFIKSGEYIQWKIFKQGAISSKELYDNKIKKDIYSK